MNMAVFHAWPALLSGRGLDAARRDVEANLVPSVQCALCVWPWVHPLSFRYVPLEHRLLVLNFCSIGVFSFATFVRDRQPVPDQASILKHTESAAAATVC